MGNTSKKTKPKPTPRGPGGAPTAPRPPRFAVVRAPSGFVEVFNIDHILKATFHASRGPRIVLETLGDVLASCSKREDVIHDPETLHGLGACELAAHLILCGVDVEGAAAALDRARPGMYPTLKLAHVEALDAAARRQAERDAMPPADCDRCHARGTDGRGRRGCVVDSYIDDDGKCADFDPIDAPDPIVTVHNEPRPECAGCIDERTGCETGYLADDAGACVNWRPVECEGCKHDDELTCHGWIAIDGDDDACGGYERDRRGEEGCACLTPPPPRPPISVEEHAAELRAMRQVDAAHSAARTAELDAALGPSPVLAGDVAGLLAERIAVARSPSDARTAGDARKAAAIAAFDVAKAAAGAAAEKMHRPRTCADCVSMTRAECKPPKPNTVCDRFELNPRQVAAERENFAKAARLVCAYGAKCERFPACADCSLYALGERHDLADPRHVEQVAGEPVAALRARVERCGVFVGMKARGVEVGKQFCGVGHEMTDPACALCPFLRINAPAR
jgi:hypothetical protein